jgi:methanogenic corrinoid protein MtbC1
MIESSEERLIELEQSLLTLDRPGIHKVLTLSGPSTLSISEVEKLVVPVLERIGQGWEQGRVSLSQVYMSGRICEEIIDSLFPSFAPGRISVPPMAIAVLEDHHMLGLRLVYSMLRASGYELCNYGRKEVDELVEKVQADEVKVLLVSVLMLRSALRVKELRHRLDQAGCAVKLVVGGAPFRLDSRLWQEVGADITATCAAGAVAAVREVAKGVVQ